MKIAGKRVLVTGGAVRVGAELVRAFAEAGADVLIHCRNSHAQAEALAASLPNPSRHRVLAADLALPGEAERLFREAGRIDILVNNASLFRLKELADSDEMSDRAHFEVNFWSPLTLMKLFARQGLSEGAVINLLDQEPSRCRAARWPKRPSNSPANSARAICASTRSPPVRCCRRWDWKIPGWSRPCRPFRSAVKSNWTTWPGPCCFSPKTIRSPAPS